MATLAQQALNILSDQQALLPGTAIIIQQADHSLEWIANSREAVLWPPMPADYRQDLQQWLGTGIRQGHHSGVYPLPLTQAGQRSGEQGFFYARYTTVDHHRVAVLSFVSMADFLRERVALMEMKAYLFLLDSAGKPLFELDAPQIPTEVKQQYTDTSRCLLQSASNFNSCSSNSGMFKANPFLHIHQPVDNGTLTLSLLLSTSGLYGLLPQIITFIVVQLLATMMIWLLVGQLSKFFSALIQSLESSIARGEPSIADPLASQRDPFHIRQFIARITHRLQQREERQWTERVSSFDHLLGKLGQGIYYFTHDRDGNMTYLSPWMRTAVGMTRPIETYHHSWLYSDTSGNQKALEETGRVLNGAETSVYELEICDKNGNRSNFEIIKIPIYDAQGHIIGAEGVGRNITRWVSDVAHFRGLLQLAPDAMVITNHLGVIVMVNARAELLTGYQGDLVLGKQLCTLIADEDCNQLCAGEKLLAAPINPSGEEINIITRSGELVPVELTMNAIETPDGLHYSMFMRDIRKRRAAEEALFASEQRLRRTIDALQHEYIFYSQHLDGSFINVTSSVQAILGYSPEYFMKHWRQLLHRNSDRTLVTQVFNILCQGGSHPSYQLEIIKADGTIATLEIYESAAMNDQGEVVAIQGLAHDRTRERRAASALAEARDKAQAASDAKTQFLSNMSHELRTPLNGILGYAQLLMAQSNITPEQQDQLQGIQASGQHLLTLINDILDLSKAESGQLMIAARPFNLMELIDSIYRMVAQQAKAKKLAFKVTISPEVPVFMIGDETKIQQILIN
ncbi:PAS domain S-box protein, partial [Endozoicomonas sp. SESOKO1]|uniref:PAS domain-containing protein n=1 Tax=Endozoicomonas sp. SESOKO1 TaxID=2828742 RepID=UPI00214954A4